MTAVDELRGAGAVITGGASGIGLATARQLGDRGARVVLADVEEAALAAAVDGLRAAGIEAHGVSCDVRSLTAVQRVGRRGVRHARRGAHRVQQRRGGGRRSSGRDDPRRLAMGHRRRPVGTDPRRRGVPAPDHRPAPRWPRAVHVVVRRARARTSVSARTASPSTASSRWPRCSPGSCDRTGSACPCCARCG